jgi:hypothetical protein
VFLLLGVPPVAREMDFVLKCVKLTNSTYGRLSQVGGRIGIRPGLLVLVSCRLIFGWFPTICTQIFNSAEIGLKTNDTLFPAHFGFLQVSFRLRQVSFGHNHHVLRKRNRSCIAKPRDFMVPASNVVLHHLKKVADPSVFRDE